MKTKHIIIISALLLLAGLAGWILVDSTLPRLMVKPRRTSPQDVSWRFPQGCAPEDYGLQAQKWTILTGDSLRLSAWLIPGKRDTTYGTVVVLHGISGCKETGLIRAQMLADSGYACLLLDLRAHGESQGDYCTFGYYEKKDLKCVADTLARRFPARPIGIWGASLGGAIALQAMAYDSAFSFGIIESTFDELPKVVEEYGADYLFGLRSAWLTRHVLKKAGEMAHFDPFSVKPVEAAAHIHRPVLFMHGERDARIPMEFDQNNYKAVPFPLKRWVSAPNAGHIDLWRKDKEHLTMELYRFLQECRTL